MKTLRRRMTDELVRVAAARMRRRHADWADALLSEHANLDGHPDQLGWAFGSLRASVSLDDAVYPTSLALSVAAAVLYQWSADESFITVLVVSGLALLLGFLRPQRFIFSGAAVGVVVCAVNGFETLSDIRPAYEIHRHTWVHDLRWLALLAPALLCSLLGRQVGLKLIALSKDR